MPPATPRTGGGAPFKRVTALEWAVFDGTPDESIDPDDQDWAMTKLSEHAYRKYFHLSKEEMLNEPLEDIEVNFMIMKNLRQREKQEQRVLEAKSKSGVQ